MSYRLAGVAIAVLMSSAALLCPAGVFAQGSPVATQPVRHGEVSSDDVYVRSGPSKNHYTITKLAAGQPVTIVGDTLEWYEIVPPDGAFSLISGDYVDASPDGSSGVVNGDRVRVRTGSLLNDNKYTVQMLLSKGAELTILERNPDGFVRIVPPDGATVWINKSFVALARESGPARDSGRSNEVADASTSNGSDLQPGSDRASPTGRKVSASETPPSSSSPDPRPGAREPSPTSAFAGAPLTAERRSLDAIDIAAHKEMARPLTERRLDPIIERYTAVAEQPRDVFARRYAEERIRQLRDVQSIIETVRDMRRMGADAASARRGFLQARASIPTVELPVPSGIDVEGVLRTSALYPPDRDPRRYRLVDAVTSHTIGYVDFPSDFAQPLEPYLNRRVGVRAAARSWQEGGVEPVVVYVAGELVLLDDDDKDARVAPISSSGPNPAAVGSGDTPASEDR